MKKLFTLFIFLCAALSSSAGTYTVYFKPGNNWKDGNAIFKLNQKKTDTDWKVTPFTAVDGIDGVYQAEYDTDYSAGIQLLRFKPDGSQQWDCTNLWGSSLSGDIFLFTKDDEWSNRDIHFYYLPGDKEIINGNDSWGGPYIINGFTLANDYATSHELKLRVTDRLLVRGKTYEYKAVNTGSGAWFPSVNENLSVDKDGLYDIEYTIDLDDTNLYDTGSVPNVATLKKEVVFKYSVQRYMGSGQDPEWVETRMTLDGNEASATLTIENMPTTANFLQYKILRYAYDTNNNKLDEKWSWNNSGVDGRYVHTANVAGDNVITIFYNPISESVWSTGYKKADKYYYLGGPRDSWAVNQDNELTNNTDGTYSIIVSNKANQTFAIAPDYAFDGTNSIEHWEYLIHPKTGDNIPVEFANNSGFIKCGNYSNNWAVNEDYSDFIKLTLNTNTNKWTIEPYFERTLPAAAEGYATFSSDKAVAIPEGITAKYPSEVTSAGVIKWETFANGIPANQGALLQGKVGTYKFPPAVETPDVVPDNETITMKPIATKDLLQQENNGYTKYILSKQSPDSDVIAFFKVNYSSGSWVNAGTAYLKVSDEAFSTAPTFFPLTGETTAIDNLTTEPAQKGEEKIYSLDGRRIVGQPTAKGIYIVNGKKLLKK